MPQNYYKSNRIQKKLPRIKDEQFEYTGMKINNHFLRLRIWIATLYNGRRLNKI